MNISRFFIHRPIFAAMLSALILLAGLLALPGLPLSEYPEVVPPTIVVHANYPGANPSVIADTVAAPLEQAINGVEGMLYQFSQATSDGVMTLTITFKLGTDVDRAQEQVQNRVAQVLPKLPEDVQRLGVTTNKASPDITLAVFVYSPDGRYDQTYLANYVALRIKDELARLDGVGDVQRFGGGDYSMRIWLNPEKVASLGLTAADVVSAIREQNVQVAAGQLGAPPAADGADFQVAINTQGRLTDESDFGNIVIKTGADGQIVHLRDVARVELGSDNYALRALLNNRTAVAIPIFQRPGSNAIAVSDEVRAKMAELKKSFPPGIDYNIAYDPTVFVRGSIEAVLHTLLEAIALVVVVVILFLQTWRASVIPLLAVPVSLIGTFAVMRLFGFGLNALSLFGLVLAIGIVVDDAIVVVENVERHIRTGLTPTQATRQAMTEVTGPIIATALVLCAVFVPTAFISGLSGEFYKQFALTIAISTIISAFNSLTLSPALSAVLLKEHTAAPDRLTRLLNGAFGWLFRPFNRLFARATTAYVGVVGRVLRASSIALLVYGGLLLLTWFGFAHTPTGFVPAQDKQYLVAYAQLPDAASLDRTEDVIRRMTTMALATPGVASVPAFPGLSISGLTNATNAGIAFTPLAAFDQRRDPSRSAGAIAASLNAKFSAIQDAYIAVFPPPPVDGLGTVGGFKMEVEDRGSLGADELYRQTQKLLAAARQRPELTGLYSGFQVNVPQVQVDVDREKAKAEGVALQDVYDTMQVYLGALYVNDFNRFGRTYQVNVQAQPGFRLAPEDIGRLQTRNQSGQMIPLGSFVTVHETSGPDRVPHYNGYLAADISGSPAPGYSSGQAQQAMEDVARAVLPNGMRFEWTELTYQQILAGNTMAYVFPLVVLLVFVVLAALYESLSLPLVVILIVPMCLLSAILGVLLSGGDNNIFTQIGLIVLVGLACKNAILIVEFARDREAQGVATLQAVLDACRLRLRPILMTSVAFIMGVVPLVVSHGAGAEMRHAMGVAVFSGMLGVTLFGLMLTPVFYRVIRGLARKGAVRAVLASLPWLGLSACAAGPDYHRPPLPVVQAHNVSGTQFSSAAYRANWWEEFNDPVLAGLERRALRGNLDLQAGLARVQAARATFTGARLDYAPHVTLDGAVTRSKEQQPGFTEEPINIDSNSAGFDASWELDLFGHVRREVQAAQATLGAQQASLEDVRVMVAAEVARNYFELRGAQRRTAVARENLVNQREALRLTQVRYDAGRVTELDVDSAEARLKATEATLPLLQADEKRYGYRLAVLLGMAPGSLDAELPARQVPVRVTPLPIGDVSTLLRRRPDVRLAERNLAAASAQVGVAAADLFPRVSFSGFIGFLSGGAAQFGSVGSHAWAATPVVSWPALDFAAARARVQGARAQASAALADYQQAVLAALEDFENSCAAYGANQGRLASIVEQAQASQRAERLAEIQYREGSIDFLVLLDAQRTLLEAQDSLAQAQTDVNTGAVAVYKALGGLRGA